MQNRELIISASRKRADIGGITLPCRIGHDGYIDQTLGAEGDKRTPLGEYRLRFGLYRADRVPAPPSPLTFWPITEHDGWCDDPNDPAYNRFVRLPYGASHERLWREDGAYDIILIISHNDGPPEPGKGSAVFIHIAQPDDRETLGCVAFAPEDMVRLLPQLRVGSRVIIQE